MPPVSIASIDTTNNTNVESKGNENIKICLFLSIEDLIDMQKDNMFLCNPVEVDI